MVWRPTVSEHFWTKIVMIPVEVTLTAEGNLDIHTRKAAEEIGEDDARIGCWFCGTPLRHASFGGTCSGAEEASSGTGLPDPSERDTSSS